MLQDTTVVCPRCELAFPLTETLAQPLLVAERAKIQRETQELTSALKKHEQDLSTRQQALEDLKRQLDARQDGIDAAVEARLQAELDVLAKTAEKKAAELYATRLQAAELELTEKRAQLAEAETAELALRKEQRTLEEEKQRLELEVERRLQAEIRRIRQATQIEEEQTYLMKLAEKDKLISEMASQIEDLRRKSAEGSQRLSVGACLRLSKRSSRWLLIWKRRSAPLPGNGQDGNAASNC